MTRVDPMDSLENAAREVVAERNQLLNDKAELLKMLMILTLHEQGIVHLLNSLGEATPAAFSADCEQARHLINRM